MSARRLAEWQAYCSLEPFGPPAAHWQVALVAATIANANRGKNQKAFKPEDFMPQSMTQAPERDEMDQEAAGRAITARFEALADLHRIHGGYGRHGE
jgi:hypothetical protein